METTDPRYYQYLNGIYKEILDFLTKEDQLVKPEKLTLFFEKRSSPYKFRKDENGTPESNQKAPVKPAKDIELENFLAALQKKYPVIANKDEIRFTRKVESWIYQEIRDKVGEYGFKYSTAKRAFLRGGTQ